MTAKNTPSLQPLRGYPAVAMLPFFLLAVPLIFKFYWFTSVGTLRVAKIKHQGMRG
jgi:hypothetical protein